jgi:hypothetical protein
MINSFADVITALGGTARFAMAVGMKPNTAKMAKARGSIAPNWWPQVVEAAKQAERPDITMEKLAELAANRRAA